MSAVNFVAAYDAIVTRLGTLYPQHKRLVDPYNIEQNPDTLLVKGWGLAVGQDGDNTNRFVGRSRTTAIRFQLSLTRKVYAIDTDPVAKANTDRDLLEDLRVIIDDIWLNNCNILGSPKIDFLSFAGIFPVRTEKGSYMQITATFSAEYIINA